MRLCDIVSGSVVLNPMMETRPLKLVGGPNVDFPLGVDSMGVKIRFGKVASTDRPHFRPSRCFSQQVAGNSLIRAIQ